MSFLQDASTLLGSAPANFHHDTTSTDPVASANLNKRVRRTQSQGIFGRLTPLVDLVRDPVSTLGSAVGAFSASTQDPEEEALAERAKQADGERKLLYIRLHAATTLDEWRSCALQLDVLEGNRTWREQDACDDYDHALVAARLRQLDEARFSGDLKRMIFLIRTSLTRSLGGMGDLRLYQHAHIGTKRLIEQYIESCKATIAAAVELSARPGAELGVKKVMEDMIYARQAFGRSALLLSGGGTFGMNHIGVVKTLWEAKLLPRIISGSSAGSIVCAVLCTRTDEELPRTLQEFCHGDLEVFGTLEDNGILQKVSRLLKFGAVFEIDHLVRVMKSLLGDLTFQEAYNRTRRILNICVSSPSVYELPRLLNYVTSPNVIIWSAVAASCSVPLVFQAATIYAKDPRTGQHAEWHGPGLSPQRWIDGSVDNDIPMARLAEMFNVNHFIVSQVNPHVVPFLAKEDDMMTSRDPAAKEASAIEAGPSWLHTMANLAKGEALHRMHVLAELGIFPTYMTKARSVLSQRYSGDITILPAVSLAQFPRVLSNPTTEFMTEAMACGERATWPKLTRISNHCAIELALDEAVHDLRSRVAFSPSQVDLRLAAYGSRSKDDNAHHDLRRHRSSRSLEKPNKRTSDINRAQKTLSQHIPTKRKGPLHFPAGYEAASGSVKLVQAASAPADILSSSAADSYDEGGAAYTSSDDDSDDSSILESPPDRKPARRASNSAHLAFRSQPATPNVSSRAFFSGASSPLMMMSVGKSKRSGATTSVAGSNKPLPQRPQSPSEVEKTYKKLFHPSSSQSQAQAQVQEHGDPTTGGTQDEGWVAAGLRKSASGLKLPLSVGRKVGSGFGLLAKSPEGRDEGRKKRREGEKKRA